MEKINTIHKPLVKLTRKMRKLHISNIRNDRGVINSDLRNSKRVIKNTLNNYKPANLMTQVRWPNKFLEIHNLLKSIQGKTDNLNNWKRPGPGLTI